MEPSLQRHLAMVRDYLQNETYLIVVDRGEGSKCYIQRNYYPLPAVPVKPISETVDLAFIGKLNDVCWSPGRSGSGGVMLDLTAIPDGKVAVVYTDALAECREVLECCRLYLQNLGPHFASDDVAAADSLVPIQDIRRALDAYVR